MKKIKSQIIFCAFIMFKIKEEKNIDKTIKKRNDIIKDYLTKKIEISPDVRCHYELIHNKLVIGIFFRYYNSYFDFNNQINQSDSGFIKFNFSEKPKFRIYHDNKGIEFNKKRGDIINEERLKQFETPKEQSFSLEPNEFIFLFRLNNI